MDYYRCSTEALRRELERRHFATYGSHDMLSEQLRADDDRKGSEATTVRTEGSSVFAPREINFTRTVEFGRTVPATQLANQSMYTAIPTTIHLTDNVSGITHWTLNTFFPTLQLFFESGLSCTIDGSRLPGAVVGLDPHLRFRLTDCTYEEQGRVTKTVIPAKFARSSAGIRILEAAVGQRTSVAVWPRASQGRLSTTGWNQDLDLAQEIHTVIGLRLSGMVDMGYIWAKVEAPPTQSGGRQWGDVRLAGLRDDIPVPILGLPADLPKPGGELMVVDKGSLIEQSVATPDRLDRLGKPWI